MLSGTFASLSGLEGAPSKPLKEAKVPDNIKKEKKETPAKQPVTTEPISQKQDFLDLLDQNVDESSSVTKEYLEDLSLNLVAKLQEFGIEGKVEGSFPGPVITRFEINLAPGTKASQVTNIANDLARSLAVKSVRVVEVIEGKSSIGIEIPNPKRKVVNLYSALKEFDQKDLNPLEFSIGIPILNSSGFRSF